MCGRYRRTTSEEELARLYHIPIPSQTGLDWVILRPSALKNDPGVGTVSLGLAQFHTEVRRDDVAATLAALAHTPDVRRKILELTEGPTPIAEAVADQTP
jgi:hypothetical protein